jgi:hypothetical protein
MVQIPRSRGVLARPTTEVGAAAPSIADTQIIPQAISGLGQTISQIGLQRKANEDRRNQALELLKSKDNEMKYKSLSDDIMFQAKRISSRPEELKGFQDKFLSEYDLESDGSPEYKQQRLQLQTDLQKLEFKKNDEFMRSTADIFIEDSKKSLLNSKDITETNKIIGEATIALDQMEQLGVITLDERNQRLAELDKVNKETNINIITENVEQAIRIQPDKDVALSDFLKGELLIEIVDEQGDLKKVNVSEGLPFDIRNEVEKKLISSIEEDNRIFQRIQKRENEEDQRQKDLLEGELHIKDINGELSQEELDKQFREGKLDIDAYKRLSISAKAGDVIDNTNVITSLDTKINAGQDVRNEILEARKKKQISSATFKRLLDNNASQRIDPISSGRLSLFDLLGASSTSLGEAGSIIKGNAGFAYNQAVEEFRQNNNRQPNFQEIREIRDDIVEEYQVFASDTIASTLAKPKFMDLDLKNFISGAYSKEEILSAEQQIKEIKKKTARPFRKRYKGDVEQAKKDPDFKKEIVKIEAFESILQNRKKSLNQFTKGKK